MSKAKVNNLHMFWIFLILIQDDHDIFRFQISVNNSDIMKVFYTQNELSNYFGSQILLNGSMLSNIFEKIFSLHKLGDNIQMGFCLNALLIEDEQWMVQYTHDTAFISMLISKFLRNQSSRLWVQLLILYHFHSILFVGFLLFALIYNRELSSTNFLAHIILLLSWNSFKELQQLHPLTCSLFILHVNCLSIIKSVPVADLNSEAFTFIKFPLNFKSIQTYDHKWMLSVSFPADYYSWVQKVQMNS